MFWPLLSWVILFVLLSGLTFPLTYRLFRRLPDRGYSLSRILGLLFWGFIFWLLTSLGLLQNSPGGILFGLVLVIGLSVWALYGRQREIRDWIKAHWRLILMVELVFLIGFAFMALVRAADPNATGTEKPMELAFINAVLKSDSFPPHDPWLSGYAISYYHFGYILTGMLAKLTFTNGGVAFNLMLAAVFGMSAAGAYGILHNLLSAFDEGVKKPVKNLTWALLGPLFLLFVSNLEAILEVLHQAGVGWDASGASQFWAWINIESLMRPPSGPATLIPQRFWWWWQASRVIQDIDLLGVVSGLSPIDEFPAFSFLLGDLHPHVLVMPFVMLLIGLALNVYRGALDGDHVFLGIHIPYRIDLFLTGAVVMGGITFLNTWDLPVYFMLLVGAFGLRQIRKKGWAWERLWEVLKLAIPLGVLALLLYLPFLLSFQSQAGGILPNLFYPTRGVYLWLMFGTLLVPILLFFGWLRRRRASAAWGWGSGLVMALILILGLLAVGLGFLIARTDFGQGILASQGEQTYGGLLVSSLLHRFVFGGGLLTLVLVLVGGLGYLLGLLRKNEAGGDALEPAPFVLLMVVLGGIMVLAPEFVYLRDHFGTRMNTIFKFYYQAWMLWSLAAAFASVVLLKRGAWITRVVVVVFILLGLVYPLLAFPNKTNNFSPETGSNLDAGAYYEAYQPDEAAAIDWLTQAETGAVAEAVGGQYSGYARVATISGQPAVLGWPGHQGQWRGGYDEVGSREQDVRTLYESADWETALAILRRYDIRYVFVGSLEMSTYALNPVKFEENLKTAFEQGTVRVYVVPDTLKE